MGPTLRLIAVPCLMFLTSAIMSVAWLAHLRYRTQVSFLAALSVSWLLVLPEYVLNVATTRLGYGTYTGAQMASFHLSFGVVCVALVSKFVLGESLGMRQMMGFALLAVATLLISYRG
jgi:uncharacterized protein (DUF486 family)